MDRVSIDSLIDRAEAVMPGGVSSPVRALRAVCDVPFVLARGEGARVWDQHGTALIDYIGSWGAAIAGHAHPAVVDAVRQVALDGLGFGATHELEIELAEEVVSRVPGAEMVRFTCSGTEAVMSALRLSRAVTGRSLVVKFDGGYHGHADPCLSEAGSGLSTHRLSGMPGVPESVRRDTVSLPYNDVEVLEAFSSDRGREVACIVVEPIAGNMGLIPASITFLRALRDVCSTHGALLVFDEVMTGFRVAHGGAQELLGVRADLVTFGKVIGGGLPIGAFAGSRELLSQVAPLGPVYHAGTQAGNPLAMAAGLTTLRLLDDAAYRQLDQTADALARGIARTWADASLEAQVQRVGSMLSVFAGAREPVRNHHGARAADHVRFARYFRGMRRAGVLLPPGGYETWFVNLAHTAGDVEATITASREVLQS